MTVKRNSTSWSNSIFLSKASVVSNIFDATFFIWLFSEILLPHSTFSTLALLLFSFVSFVISIKKRILKSGLAVFCWFFFFTAFSFLLALSGETMSKTVSFKMIKTLLINSAFLFAFSCYVAQTDLKRFLHIFVISLSIVSLLGFLINFVKTSSINLREDTAFFNANFLAVLDAFAIIASIFCFKKANRMLYIVSSIPLLLVIISSGARKAFLALALGLILFFMVDKPSKILRNCLVVLSIAALFCFAIFKIPVLYNKIGVRFESLFSLLSSGSGSSSENSRAYYIEVGFNAFKGKPFTGIGIDCFRLIPNSWGYPIDTYSHCNYIELLSGVGVIGFALYYCLHFISIILYVRHPKKLDPIIKFFLIVILITTFLDVSMVSYFERVILILPVMCFSGLKNQSFYQKNNVLLCLLKSLSLA